MNRKTRLTVDLAAIKHNAGTLKALAGDALLMAVVKANAYGHGMLPVARAALSAGADWLAVALPEEGVKLREEGISAPVLVLGLTDKDGAELSARYGLTQTVCDAEGVEHLQSACRSQSVRACAHLKLDTGMGRVGARTEDEVKNVLRTLEDAPDVALTGAFTHFADADGESEGFTLSQIARFDRLRASLPGGLLFHAAASAAALRYPQARYGMIRPGILLYGCSPIETALDLRPAMSLRTEIVYVKTIETGETVSYGRAFTAPCGTRVATLPVGYGDGYLRACSGRAKVLIKGEYCPVLGRVCMDQMMVDVTRLQDVRQGDEAVLLGRQGDRVITADMLAAWAGTISYEILLSPTPRVPTDYIG